MAEGLCSVEYSGHVLQAIHTGGNKASANHTPQEAEAPTEEMGQGSSVVKMDHTHLAP